MSGDLDMTSECLGIIDDGVDLLASKLCNLRRVNLSGNYLISDKSVISLAEKGLNLEPEKYGYTC